MQIRPWLSRRAAEDPGPHARILFGPVPAFTVWHRPLPSERHTAVERGNRLQEEPPSGAGGSARWAARALVLRKGAVKEGGARKKAGRWTLHVEEVAVTEKSAWHWEWFRPVATLRKNTPVEQLGRCPFPLRSFWYP